MLNPIARLIRLLAALLLGAGQAASGAGDDTKAQDASFRAIYQELVEINTTDSSGDTTLAAQAMAAHLRKAGFDDHDLTLVVPPDAPRKGNLVARLRGSGARKPLLLLAHLDVVEAKREDWKRDPFKLLEENGVFSARGAIDDKAMAAAFVANLATMRARNLVPQRDIILALTADEEMIPSRYNGVSYLLAHHRELIDAEFAINEGGFGTLDENGRALYQTLQVGEKVFQTFRLEVTNPGGHSARPTRDNAIYHLAEGLVRLGRFDFPVRINAATRAYLQRAAAFESDPLAGAMRGAAQDPPDASALEKLSNQPGLNAMIRTTCVATMLEAGHATNALPQRARAVVNCRILPGEPVAEVKTQLVKILGDEQIQVSADGDAVESGSPPLASNVITPIEKVAAEMWPGVPVIPTMFPAATDGRFLNNAGIWTYGITGLFARGPTGTHGLNEHIGAAELYRSREFLDRLVSALANPD